MSSLDGDPRPNGAPRPVLAASFTEIYQCFFNFVWSCARRMGIPDNEIDDVVQDVFIVIHGRLKTLEQPESLRSWIYGIIRRTASTYHRARRMKVTSAAALNSEPLTQYPEQPSPQDLALRSDESKLLWSLLAKLDAPKREVFVLAELDEMTAPEIAAAIEVPLNTVYSRLRSARQDVEAALARHHAQMTKGGRP